MRLKVSEIFTSIQGESSLAGLPCVFVRATGCPLSCRWCDTEYAKQGGRDMDLMEIVDLVLAESLPLVELTGGEPLCQAGGPELARLLLDRGLKVMVETSGAMDISVLDARAKVIMDVKCPGSGMTGRMDWANLERLLPHHEVKFVLASREDYEFARRVIREHDLANRTGVLISCVMGELEPAHAVEWMLSDRLPARFQLQLHKYIWIPQTRGV